MAGRGNLNEAHEIDTSRIYTLRNGRWQKMFRPINPDRSFSGVCLAESFAEAYSKKYNVDVGLICCADGGTKLDQWMPGELLFDNAVNNARLAARTSEIVGVLWHQGESDCNDTLYPTYQVRFETMMKALRKELKLNDVPFVLGGLGEYLEFYPLESYVHINHALQAIATDNEMVGFASAKGLTSNPDNLHFNAQSLYDFGIRYFEEFEKLNRRTDTVGKKNIKQDILRNEMELL
ncbi:MAG: sialate O-acetylesterase [Clostridia bacterium]|nr:sialate O-acetylesterase [Clostridia bacterium]